MMIGFYDIVIPADMTLQQLFAPKKTETSTGGQ